MSRTEVVKADLTFKFLDVPMERFNVFCMPIGGDVADQWTIGCEDWDDDEGVLNAQVFITLTDEQARKLLAKMTSQMLEKKDTEPKRDS